VSENPRAGLIDGENKDRLGWQIDICCSARIATHFRGFVGVNTAYRGIDR
jgi:hypothetical protein